MPRITVGPTGSLIRGDVLDCAPKAFQRTLQDYDKQLYLSWNPKKVKGWGCWEIRRAPTHKTAVYQGEYAGASYYRLLPVEFNAVHHVLDCAFLNYDAVNKLKRMDTFVGGKSFSQVLEEREAAHREAVSARAKEELKYAIKQHKSAARDFYELVRSGVHPAQVLLSTKWVSK